MGIIECGICVDFLQDAQETPCNHLFCGGCLRGWLRQRPSCPICRAPVASENLLRPAVVIQRFVDSMTLDCPNAGCPVTPSRRDLSSHLAACEFRPEKVLLQQQQRRAALEARSVAQEALFRAGKIQDQIPQMTALAADLLSVGDVKAAALWAERAAASEIWGDALFQMGEWQQAVATYPKTSHAKLADCYVKLGKYEEAEACLKQLPSNDVTTLLKLGELKKKLSAYPEALMYLENALRLTEEKSAMWISLSMSRADVLRKTESYDQSRQLYQQVLKYAQLVHGKKSRQVAGCLNALGILTKKLGHYDSAQKYYKAAIKLKVFLNGNSHQNAEIAEYLTNLADVFRKKSEYGQAEALYRRALEIFEATVGTQHIECADTLNSLGLIAKKQARYDEAADLYDRALAIAHRTFKGKPHYKTGIYAFNRADIERKRGNYTRALEMYTDSLEMIRTTLGPTHSEAADPLHSMGLVHHQLGDYKKAVACINEALQIVRREFGQSHYKVGVFLASLGSAKAMLEDFEGCEVDLKKALHILIATLGESHIEVADVLSALGDNCLKLLVEKGGRSKLEEAKNYYNRARTICIDRLGPDHTKVQQMDSLIFIADNYDAVSR